MQSSRVKKIGIIGLVCLAGYWLYPSDYETLMKPIKKIKEEEKRLGKESPTFDGYTEPDFPNERENNKTLEGVDSNGDGVRDDVEIWINRNAEDMYVRIALKNFATKYYSVHLGIESMDNENELRKKSFESNYSLGCLTVVSKRYNKKSLQKNELAIAHYYMDVLHELLFNTTARSSLVSKLNGYQFMDSDGALDNDFNRCDSRIDKKYILQELENSNELKIRTSR